MFKSAVETKRTIYRTAHTTPRDCHVHAAGLFINNVPSTWAIAVQMLRVFPRSRITSDLDKLEPKLLFFF